MTNWDYNIPMLLQAKDKKTNADYYFKIEERELKDYLKWLKKEGLERVVKNEDSPRKRKMARG